MHVNVRMNKARLYWQFTETTSKNQTTHALLRSDLEDLEKNSSAVDRADTIKNSAFFIGDYDIDTKTGNVFLHERLSAYVRPWITVMTNKNAIHSERNPVYTRVGTKI